jgi:2-phosphosulfolactate phosphatase
MSVHPPTDQHPPQTLTLHVCLSPLLVRPATPTASETASETASASASSASASSASASSASASKATAATTPERNVVAVIDVLRASTTICTALQNGARAVRPFASLEAARAAFAALPPQEQAQTLLGGERSSIKPDGFHCGNSPLEYTAERVAGRTIFFTTTNGTFALEKAQEANTLQTSSLQASTDAACGVCIAGFVNAQAAVRWLLAQAQSHQAQAVTLICAGSAGAVSYEDTLCAGLMVTLLEHEARNKFPATRRTDAAVAAAELVEFIGLSASAATPSAATPSAATPFNAILLERVQRTQHGATLAALGFGSDIVAALATDTMSVVPAMRCGMLVAE